MANFCNIINKSKINAYEAKLNFNIQYIILLLDPPFSFEYAFAHSIPPLLLERHIQLNMSTVIFLLRHFQWLVIPSYVLKSYLSFVLILF